MTGPPASGVRSRVVAYRALRRVHTGGAWSVPAVDAALRGADLPPRDRAFAANLAYQTLRWEGTLDWALSQVLTRPLEEVEPEILDVLRLGAWQLLRSRAPDRAAVATAVDVARAEVGPRATGFVNGVLRTLSRRKEQLPWPPRDDDRGLALATGYPTWIVAQARLRFGDRAGAVLEAGNVAPGVTLRAVVDRQALLEELRAAGLDARPGEHAPEAVHVGGADPAELPCVVHGRAVVQDEASMLVGRAVVAPLPGAAAGPVAAAGWVVDACAAPGGKSTHLAQLGARVAAADLRPRRAALVVEAAARVGLADRVAVVVADAAAPPFPAGRFAAALVDAPCTGLGVVRRRPELRWRRQASDPERLGKLQLTLLEAAAELVAPGGRLVYAVCTWTAAETALVARAFAAVHGDRFSPLDLGPALGGAGARLPGDGGVQLAPDADGVDGMYLHGWTRRRAPPGSAAR